MDHSLSDMMAELLILHGNMGKSNALLKWVEASDPDGLTNQCKNLKFETRVLTKRIRLLDSSIDLILTDDEMSILRMECKSFGSQIQNQHELELSLEYKPHHFSFNPRALLNRSDKDIPFDVQIGLSFGWKFQFPAITTSENINKNLAQIEYCIDNSINEALQHEVYIEVARVLRSRSCATLDTTIQWLRFLAYRTEKFLRENRDVFASRSDKGAHTVVLNTADYDRALMEMLNDDCYIEVAHSPLMKLIHTERILVKMVKKNHKTKEIAGGCYEPATLTLAKFYGLLKIHKEGFRLRPIMAMHNSPGAFIGRVFNSMISSIFPQSGFHFKDSYMAKRIIDDIKLKKDDVLVSFDVVSMYTNIPRDLAHSIVIAKRHEFYNKFGIGRTTLEKLLKFLLTDCTVFTALDKMYSQQNGLPMGGSISTNLARLVMDQIISYTLTKTNLISFIKVFVDDTIAVIKRDQHEAILGILNSFHPSIKFTYELENENKSLNFLNLTLIREQTHDGEWTMVTGWFGKRFASGRLLPYYSSHKRTTVMQTAVAFIHTVLSLSDAKFFTSNREIVENTLYLNGFPQEKVALLMNNHYTLMTAQKRAKKCEPGTTYNVFPHAICEARRLKRVLHKYKNKNVIYSDSTRNSKINFVSTRKTITPIEKRGNLIVVSHCTCGKKRLVTMTNFNENGHMAVKRLSTTFSECGNGMHAYKKFKFIRGLTYRGQTRYLGKYIAIGPRGSTDNRGLGLPNLRLLPLARGHVKCNMSKTYSITNDEN